MTMIRHFFLSQYFRENYAKSLKNYPLISSPINITRIELWITNRNASVQKILEVLLHWLILAEPNSEGFVSLDGLVIPSQQLLLLMVEIFLQMNLIIFLRHLLGPQIRDIATVE